MLVHEFPPLPRDDGWLGPQPVVPYGAEAVGKTPGKHRIWLLISHNALLTRYILWRQMGVTAQPPMIRNRSTGACRPTRMKPASSMTPKPSRGGQTSKAGR